MRFKRWILALLFGFTLLAAVACEQEGPIERAGERVDETAERAGEKVEDATER